ncbi:MAG: hypothetical protein O9288_17470, partial [Novosphingobium sp.]|uniref:hypothetical protein n=1 Tax=Novosphingobium sp. TaxID=1874826 RepID=UPI0022C73606
TRKDQAPDHPAETLAASPAGRITSNPDEPEPPFLRRRNSLKSSDDGHSLIFRSFIVVCDFTRKNPNVFYEAGIAHTLGKHVIPITQSLDDIPFDLRHHRHLTYLGNGEGITKMRVELVKRFTTLDGQR